MKRLVLIGSTLVLLLGLTPQAQAQIIPEETCKTYHSFNGNSKVKLCAAIYQDTTYDFVWARFHGTAVSGYQQPQDVTVTLRLFTTDSATWCDGRAPNCSGGGDVVAAFFGGMPALVSTNNLGPNEHYCSGFGRIEAFIRWPGGGTSSPVLASNTTTLVSAGCI